MERLETGRVASVIDADEFPGLVAAIRDREDLDAVTRRAILGHNARRLLGARLERVSVPVEGGPQ